MSFKYTVSSELTKQKETPRLGKQVYGCWGDGSGEELVREFGMDRYTLLYLKWITKKGLLCPLLYREFCSTLGGSLDGRGD